MNCELCIEGVTADHASCIKVSAHQFPDDKKKLKISVMFTVCVVYRRSVVQEVP
jgi:hypothetical protein